MLGSHTGPVEQRQSHLSSTCFVPDCVPCVSRTLGFPTLRSVTRPVIEISPFGPLSLELPLYKSPISTEPLKH